ncbi:carbohydrate binding protein [Roseimicrobium gellanilyticum]|uniref:Carbohydrate binding protein n=1 Tax=Roseimicrobium gellanilyticum TaxID=748857 RepID=A0A366HS97_9BACT|nr:carbohydrate binding domain-containing protein [Roseimicrobium gellanilyticum]RBP46551.1 carbohydrate binding protein [Roseimicrobium gellanilyticum]
MKLLCPRIVHVATVAFVCVLSVTHACAQGEPTGGRPDLLTNAGFENGMDGWTFGCHQKKGEAALDTEVKRNGNASLRITNAGGDDSFLKQAVKIKPKTRYRLSGYIKTKDVVVKGGQAATLALEGGFESSDSVKGTNSWKKFDFEFDSAALETAKVGPRLGGHSSMAVGTAWYDDLKLIELGPSRNR